MKIRHLVLTALLATPTLSLADASPSTAKTKPNILWITSEDNNVTFLRCYGNQYAETPHLDTLAKNGFRYTNCYSNGAVCSASRSSWITGMLSPSTGLLNHRSVKDIPKSLKLYPTAIRDAGYYTSNFYKMDYNIKNYDQNTWDSYKLNWDVLKKNQPFFQVVNLIESHESRAMSTKYSTHDPEKVIISSYHPDVPEVRANYTSYYEFVTKMDTHFGRLVDELKKSGMADNTIVIYCSDHGGPLPRGKRVLYDSGTHCPLILSIPEKFKYLWPAEKPGMTVDRLVAFIDMIPTWIDMAGGKAPANYQGKIFLGPHAAPERQYNYSFRGRSDERIENVRSFRTKRFLYVKNYMPYVPRGQHLDYQWKIPIQRAWEQCYKNGTTNAIQSRFFKQKAKDELYDSEKDSDNTNNLIENAEYKDIVQKLKGELKSYQKKIYDSVFLPESELDKLAADHKTTVYDVLRNKNLYDIDRYFDVADTALEKDPSNINTLTGYLKDKDRAVRYWGSIGLMMLGKDAQPAQKQLEAATHDSCDNVRLMAAWALMKMGDQKLAHDTIAEMLTNGSYACLDILNVIAWMGKDGDQFLPTLKVMSNLTVSASPYNDMLVKQLRGDLIRGIGVPAEKKNKKKNKNKKRQIQSSKE